jgi:phosphoribosylformylglycinamidine (FGAM) synthase PurS component
MAAVVDLYVNTEEKFLDPQNNAGSNVLKSIVTFEITTDYSAGSVIRLFKDINSNNKISKLTIMCDALTTAANNDLGYYKVKGGAVVDVDVLADGFTLASASRVLDGMVSVAIENVGKRHWQIAGKTINVREAAYDICLTINTATTANGTITAILEQEIN